MVLDTIKIRRAEIRDIDFIVDAIVAAEKSGTDNFGLAKVFEVTEDEMRGYIKQMLEEEVDGCELSLSSFIVADYDDEPVAAFGGWIECRNEDDLPSVLLKSNLINFFLPKEKVLVSVAKSNMVKPLQIEREEGAYQLEYSYTKPDFRGLGLMGMIINSHILEYQQNGGGGQSAGSRIRKQLFSH